MPAIVKTVVLLALSNVFMTFAWYAHLRNLSQRPWLVAALASWGIALFEYLLQVPANRIGYTQLRLGQLKILQEVNRARGVRAGLDLQGLPLVRSIFRLRERLMRSKPPPPRIAQGMLQELFGLGWGVLVDQPGRLIIGGAACQPWKADVVFRPIAPDRFAAYAEPDQVKIAWTFEAEPLGPAATRFSTETRAVATDAIARTKFRRYWRWARFGIVVIRLLLLPAVRREAERRWRTATRTT